MSAPAGGVLTAETLTPHPGDRVMAALAADSDVEAFLEEVDRRLRPLLRRSRARVPAVEPLRTGTVYQMSTGGKRVRAAVCVAACEMVGGVGDRALSFACAMEHMQNFTLIHDDIADGDTERRGQPALWTRFGVGHGVNIGDLFVPLAALSILEAPYSDAERVALVKLLAQFGIDMAEGQALDLNLRHSSNPTVEEYMECTRKKTGSFLAMAAVGGGLLGGGTEGHLKVLRDFAERAGTAFQVRDDILDVYGEKGRATGSDVLEGKRTLLVIHAAREARPAERRRLFDILDRDRSEKTEEDVRWVCDLYGRARAVDFAEHVAGELVEGAAARLAAFPETPAKYRFLRIARYLGKRDR
ncbi:MAG TPA: polyprenyl synthetase family protein [Longimicrobiaceae bacterium]|nr:polyprenyl synthetase family protein [Longimicrobiaceae bacterium]